MEGCIQRDFGVLSPVYIRGFRMSSRGCHRHILYSNESKFILLVYDLLPVDKWLLTFGEFCGFFLQGLSLDPEDECARLPRNAVVNITATNTSLKDKIDPL